MTPIRILSDLHFGHPSCNVEFVEQLRPLIEGVSEKLVINGDLCEQRHGKFKVIGEEFVDDFRALIDEYGVELVLTRGNHDPFIVDSDYLRLGSREQIFVTHGDLYFRDISPWSRRADHFQEDWKKIWDEMLPEVATDLEVRCEYTQRARQLGAKYRDDFKTGRFHLIKTAMSLAWPPRRPYKIIETWLTAHHRAARFTQRYCPKAEVVIFGHTHFRGDWEIKGRRIINTGGFLSSGKASAVDLDGDNVTLRKIERREDGSYDFR